MATAATRTRKRRSDAGKPRKLTAAAEASAPSVGPVLGPSGPPRGEAGSVPPEEAAESTPPVSIGAEQAEPVSVSESSGVRRLSKKKQQEQAEQAAAVLLTILDGAVGVMLGEEARMEPHEQQMIVDPLGRIMARMEPGTTELIEKWSDPIILLFGFATWGARLWTIASDHGDDGRSKKPPEVVPPDRNNGKTFSNEVPPASPPVGLTSRVQVEHAEIRPAQR